jgi:hypothetical protein
MTTVPDVSGVAHVDGSYYLSCAVLTGGSIKCWGDKSIMWFGDGQDKIENMSKVPVSVSDLSNATDIFSILSCPSPNHIIDLSPQHLMLPPVNTAQLR